MQTARRIDMGTNAISSIPRVPRARQINFAMPFGKIALILFITASLVFIYVYQLTLVTQNSMEITELKERIYEQKTINDKLKIEDVVLQSPERLEQLATDSLGMIKPETFSYIVIPAPNATSHGRESKKRGVLSSIKSLWLLNGG